VSDARRVRRSQAGTAEWGLSAEMGQRRSAGVFVAEAAVDDGSSVGPGSPAMGGRALGQAGLGREREGRLGEVEREGKRRSEQ
jgi:hypothetical protein